MILRTLIGVSYFKGYALESNFIIYFSFKLATCFHTKLLDTPIQTQYIGSALPVQCIVGIYTQQETFYITGYNALFNPYKLLK